MKKRYPKNYTDWLCCVGLISTGFAVQAQTWQPLMTPNACSLRHGNAAALIGDSLYAVGGRGIKPLDALNPKTNRWTSGPKMQQGRHGTQAVVYRGQIYSVAGSANHGGGPELNTVEVMK